MNHEYKVKDIHQNADFKGLLGYQVEACESPKVRPPDADGRGVYELLFRGTDQSHTERTHRLRVRTCSKDSLVLWPVGGYATRMRFAGETREEIAKSEWCAVVAVVEGDPLRFTICERDETPGIPFPGGASD